MIDSDLQTSSRAQSSVFSCLSPTGFVSTEPHSNDTHRSLGNPMTAKAVDVGARICRRFALGLGICLLVLVWHPANFASGQTMINTQNNFGGVSDSFFNHTGVNWGLNFGNSSGSGSRSRGGFSFGAPAIPQFGGYSPGSGANFGFARTGNPSFNFGITMAKGSNRVHTSTGVGTTSLNGYPSNFFSGSVRPFVTGFIPVVSNGGYFDPYAQAAPYRYPYAYRVYLDRENSRGYSHPSISQSNQAAGHVGAHDHGHNHQASNLGRRRDNQYGRNHWIVQPVYGYWPNCGYPTPYAYNGFFDPYLNAWNQNQWRYANQSFNGVAVTGWGVDPGAGGAGYADGYGNFAMTPIPGTTAAGILQAQADAVAQVKQAMNQSTTAPPAVKISGATDPLGNPISQISNLTTQDPASIHPPASDLATSEQNATKSTATQAVESVSTIRKRLAQEDKIATNLRHAAIQRLIDDARTAYAKGDLDNALQISKNALQRCQEGDSILRTKIERGIQVMSGK